MQFKNSFSKEMALNGVQKDFPAWLVPCPVVSLWQQQGAGLRLLLGAFPQAALGH